MVSSGMSGSMRQAVPASASTDVQRQRRAIFTIASATGVASLSVLLWIPFLPLFMLQVGATDDANAAFWVAAALTCQGVARLIGGPLWGALSDRLGRKKMFVRALFCTAAATAVLAAIHSPWQLIIALSLQGLAGGYTPAAVALASVSVPDDKLKSALSMLSGSQYIGGAIGPAVGAVLAAAVGFRSAALISALMVVAVGVAVMFAVPADSVAPRHSPGGGAQDVDGARPKLEPFRPGLQLGLAILVYFTLFALGNFRVVSTSLALKQIVTGDVMRSTGIAYAFGGLASALGVLVLSAPVLRRMHLRTVLVATTLLSAGSYFLLAASNGPVLFVLGFALASLLNASMFPATNTLIALNTSRSRRGTAFGLASGAQAMAFMAGPMSATMFAASSLKAGFMVIGALMVVLAVVIGMFIREPNPDTG